jgi:hypothetical protein
MSILALPDDVLHMLGEHYVPYMTLRALRSTCKLFYRAMASDSDYVTHRLQRLSVNTGELLALMRTIPAVLSGSALLRILIDRALPEPRASKFIEPVANPGRTPVNMRGTDIDLFCDVPTDTADANLLNPRVMTHLDKIRAVVHVVQANHDSTYVEARFDDDDANSDYVKSYKVVLGNWDVPLNVIFTHNLHTAITKRFDIDVCCNYYDGERIHVGYPDALRTESFGFTPRTEAVLAQVLRGESYVPRNLYKHIPRTAARFKKYRRYGFEASRAERSVQLFQLRKMTFTQMTKSAMWQCNVAPEIDALRRQHLHDYELLWRHVQRAHPTTYSETELLGPDKEGCTATNRFQKCNFCQYARRFTRKTPAEPVDTDDEDVGHSGHKRSSAELESTPTTTTTTKRHHADAQQPATQQ